MKTYQKIKQVRVLLNLTQADMAEKLDISQKAYSNCENGKTQLTEEKIENICTALDICPTQLNTFDVNVFLSILKGTFKYNQLADNERETFNLRLKEKDTQIAWLRSRLDTLGGNNQL